jgi:hypothetical protein
MNREIMDAIRWADHTGALKTSREQSLVNAAVVMQGLIDASEAANAHGTEHAFGDLLLNLIVAAEAHGIDLGRALGKTVRALETRQVQ